MQFVIILIVVAVIIVIVTKSSDKAQAEQLEKERIERQKKDEAEANAKKAKFEVITDAEKQKLSVCGEDVLLNTLNAFNKAVKGDSDAMVLMGLTYQVKLKNPSKTVYWMEKSANTGSSEGLYWYGECFVSGYGVPENRIKGVSMIMDAARKGNKQAIQSLKDNGMSVAEMRSIGIPV